ncbi:MAG: GxxExxY protein [bacterium]|nr:GxxExxY protein [bacterium]
MDGCLLVKSKQVDKIHPINKARLLSYMKPLDVALGLLNPFQTPKPSEGVTRLILTGANLE